MKNLIPIMLIAVFSMDCTTSEQKNIVKITTHQLKAKQIKGVQIIDVRTKEEFDRGRIPSARNIVLSKNFVRAMSSFKKTEPVILYCHSGGRSTQASEQLKVAGFKIIYNYEGGWDEWIKQGNIVETDK